MKRKGVNKIPPRLGRKVKTTTGSGRNHKRAERSEAPPLSIPDRTSGNVENLPGMATSSTCPRRGSIQLTSPNHYTVVIETNCKTWGCLSCRDRLMNAFKMRVELSCLALARSALITVTYKRDDLTLAGVKSVLTKDWRELWRRWNLRHPRLHWLKVTELTQAGMPHHHLVAGPIPQRQRINCYGTAFEVVPFLRRMDVCPCLSHAMSRLWWDITGDSFIVHATPVISAAGAAAYIGKYVGKTMYDRSAYESLGIKRRWSSSRGHPGSGRLRLAQTEKGGWLKRSYQHGKLNFGFTANELSAPHLLVRNGQDLRLRLSALKQTKATINRLERMLHHAD